MTIHVISVGTSLHDNLFADPYGQLGADGDPGAEALAQAIKDADPASVLANAAGGRPGGVRRRLTATFGETPTGTDAVLAHMIKAVAPQRWRRTVSAELDTMARAGGAHSLSDQDVAILVASDTTPGLTAAMWNALALVDGNPGRVRFTDDCERPLTRVRGSAVIVLLDGLHMGTGEGFRLAMRGLGILGRALVDTVAQPGEDFRFYLSGGYKATIPYLIGLAEGLRSMPAGHPVDAFVLHETTTSEPVRLPLRRFRPEQLMQELAHFDAGPQKCAPAADLFAGYAYDERPGGWALTAFGEGLAALYANQSEGLPLR